MKSSYLEILLKIKNDFYNHLGLLSVLLFSVQCRTGADDKEPKVSAGLQAVRFSK